MLGISVAGVGKQGLIDLFCQVSIRSFICRQQLKYGNTIQLVCRFPSVVLSVHTDRDTDC